MNNCNQDGGSCPSSCNLTENNCRIDKQSAGVACSAERYAQCSATRDVCMDKVCQIAFGVGYVGTRLRALPWTGAEKAPENIVYSDGYYGTINTVLTASNPSTDALIQEKLKNGTDKYKIFIGPTPEDNVVCKTNYCPLDCNGGKCVHNTVTNQQECDCSSAPTRSLATCWGADGDAPPNDARYMNTVRSGKYCEVESLPDYFVTRMNSRGHVCDAGVGFRCTGDSLLQALPPLECVNHPGDILDTPVMNGLWCAPNPLPDVYNYKNEDWEGQIREDAGMHHSCDREY